MRARNTWAPVAVSAMLVAGAWAFVRVYLYSAESGEVFPPMSSLRADPRGSRALHDALESMPGYRVRRWFRPLKEFRDSNSAMLVLGESAFAWRIASEKDLEEIEAVASRGVRYLVSLQVPKRSAPSKVPLKFIPSVETRWRIRLASGLQPLDESWTVFRESQEGKPVAIERKFGKGSVAFVSESFPFTNEALRDDRDSGLIAWAIGDHRDIVFDEFHLGTEQTGSIGTLVRRFHLEPAAAVLLLLAVLFIWRGSSSFLPPAPEAAVQAIAGRDSAEGLASLLRRAIAPAALPATALELWRKSAALLPAIPKPTKQAVEEELARPVAPARLLELWRHLHQLTSKRT